MRRFIITGAPGAGKTAIIRQLEVEGFRIVEPGNLRGRINVIKTAIG